MRILIDSGVQHSFINEKYLKSIDQFKYSNNHHQKCFLANGFSSFTVTKTVYLNILIDGVMTNIPAFITKNLCNTLILDMAYLLKYDLEIQLNEKSILFHFNAKKIMIPIDTEITSVDFSEKLSSSMKLYLIYLIPSFQSLNTIITPLPLNTIQQAISNLSHHIRDQVQHYRIQSLLFRFESIFDTSKYTIAYKQLSHVIETYPHIPSVTKCYPNNPTSIFEMRFIIRKSLEAGLVRASQSPYATPALVIKKKDQTWRFVVDYKKLNAITIQDNYPLPNMKVTLQTLCGGYCYFTKLDLKSGFWKLSIDAKDRYKTAFITPFGLFEWLVLLQGPRNGAASFQRIMNNRLCPYSELLGAVVTRLHPKIIVNKNHPIY